MQVHVLLYDAGQENEGIHSLELAGKTAVLMFENADDAERYAGLLEAQDFPVPTIEQVSRDEIEEFCRQAGYEARHVESGFMPNTDEERLLLAPPEANRDVSNWQDQDGSNTVDDQSDQQTELTDLEAIRKRLEGLL
ncbi:MAG: DUF3110 domain-containing protein [Prochlorococcus sp.]|jgi:hypothetical protein|tara:strand:- start:487 stop:897 length:411 start_codon:yes stop_codon:yes gene_type:complete